VHGLDSVLAGRKTRSTAWKQAQAEASSILVALGLDADPLAIRIGRRLAQAEYESAILERTAERRGRVDKSGELRPAYRRLLDLRQTDLASCRQLLDELRAMGAGPTASLDDARRKILELATAFPGACEFRAELPATAAVVSDDEPVTIDEENTRVGAEKLDDEPREPESDDRGSAPPEPAAAVDRLPAGVRDALEREWWGASVDGDEF